MESRNDARESDSEDENYEDPVELIKEFGNHPLMQRAQKALLAQLKESQERLDADLREKDEELKRLSQERENLGVQLYSNQQQLAKLQVALEAAHNEFNSLVDAKIQEQEILKDIDSNNMEQKALLEEHKKQQKKYMTELDSLTETLKQIENYNEEVRSEIAVTRRATYKAEQSMQNLEKYKQNQDLYVDSLNSKIKLYQERIAAAIEQHKVQVDETAEANSVLVDTVKELELIANEKKQLMTQWKASLAGLSRRDEALSQASQTLANAESAVHDFDVEIESVRRNILKEQAKHEVLINDRDKLENELQWVEENHAKLKAERDQLQERYTLLNKSYAQTEVDAKKVDAQAKQIRTEMDTLLQNLMLVNRERQRLEDEVQLAMSIQSNVSKAVQNLLKEQAKLLHRIHERENEVSEIENEISRTKVDALDANSVNDQLKEAVAAATKELAEKDALIEKYQIEIRQRNDEIEKKMYRVDRLNKKYEKMVEAVGGEENLGPLENVVKNLTREIERVVEECKELEREWLRRQTELVSLSTEADRISEVNNELQARVTILTQRQLRLTKDLRNLQSEVKAASHTDADLQKDIVKLNALISNNQTQEGELQNANYVLEMECVEELRQLEKESVTLQSAIAEVRSAKAGVLDQIMDTERQALLWEKKIQIDKETREALDPTAGQHETVAMEKEIHRMTLREEALKREQERLSLEMERAVNKRTSISTRYKSRQSGNGSASSSSLDPAASAAKANLELTQASLKKRVAVLKKDTRELAEQTQDFNAKIEERKAALSEMTTELERVTSQYGSTEEANHKLQGDINDLLYQKQLAQERISYRQKFLKRLKDLSATGIDPSQGMQVERRLLSATQALDNLKEILYDLQNSHPHLQEVLRRVVTMADPGLF